MDIPDILNRVRTAKEAVDYETANKLTALLLLRWQVQTENENVGLHLTYLRSYTDLSRNDPFFDLVAVGEATIAVPAISPLFVALLFQKREEGCKFLTFGLRARLSGAKKKLETPGSMVHLLEGFEDDFDLFPQVLR